MLDRTDKGGTVSMTQLTYVALLLSTIGESVIIPPNAITNVQFGYMFDGFFAETLNQLGQPGTNYSVKLRKAADSDLTVPDGIGNGGGNILYRLREGIERFLITDINNAAASAQAQSTVFIMLDQLASAGAIEYFNHIPGGCNVLYLDGHVDFIRYVSSPSGSDDGATPPVLPSVATVVGVLSAASE